MHNIKQSKLNWQREKKEEGVGVVSEMDGRGGCCIARYSAATAGGGGFGDNISYGMSKVERIMLKYRPIVPKPMAAGSGSCSTVENSRSYDGARRRKRKYVRSNGGKTKKLERRSKTASKKRKVSESPSSSSVSGGGNSMVTLSLMPETPDRKEKSPSTSENRDILSSVQASNPNKPTTIFMISFNNQQQMISADHTVVTASAPPRKLQIISVVTVECVTAETWVNGNELVFTDKVMNMEMETCPSFITNNQDTVVWTNKAYKEMTAGSSSDETTVVVVKKVNRVTLPVSHPGFTCRVKVTWGNIEGDTSPATITAPCDVWQLPTGGCGWRLDTKAALCLGRP